LEVGLRCFTRCALLSELTLDVDLRLALLLELGPQRLHGGSLLLKKGLGSLKGGKVLMTLLLRIDPRLALLLERC
jgi:hypothetical protein